MGNVEMVGDLILADAHVGAKRDAALAAAVHNGDATLVDVLLEAGANVHTRGNLLLDAVVDAALGGSLEVVRKLLKAKADVHIGRERALHIAVVCGRVELVSMLLEAGADVDAREDLLMRAVGSDSHDVLDRLLVTDIGTSGCNYGALRVAVERGEAAMVVSLIMAGSKAPRDVDLLGLALKRRDEVGATAFTIVRTGPGDGNIPAVVGRLIESQKKRRDSSEIGGKAIIHQTIDCFLISVIDFFLPAILTIPPLTHPSYLS
ncbi:hypothetical protein HDV00_001252 [Rhizophlyctis rosea]|nr:hypothetical protein HDV00_001252 [Rhizophlyctis rosea]